MIAFQTPRQRFPVRPMWGVPIVLALLSLNGGCSQTPGGNSWLGGRSAKESAQLAKDKDRIMQSLLQQHPGSVPSKVNWHEPQAYYAALEGVVGRKGYSGLSQVFSREEALESVAETNKTIRDLHSPGEERFEMELRTLEPIGWQIVVEYDAGQGSEQARYKATYLVFDQVALVNGELKREGRQVVRRGSSSVSADSTIRSNR